jgi:hypothetical protein
VIVRFDAGGDVLATAADGSFVVARDERIEIYRGTASYVVDVRPVHVGVSLGAERLAVGTRDGLELWSGATRAWAVASPSHFGRPSFHGDRVITHHHGCVLVWDGATGELIRVIEDRRITIARESFALRGDTIALRCSTNAANVANVALIEISLSTGEVIGLRRPHLDGTLGAAAMSDGTIVTAGPHDLRIDEGTHRLEYSLSNFAMERLYMSRHRFVLGGRDGQVRTLSSGQIHLAALETGRPSPIVHVRDDGAEIHAIDARGGVFAWPAPGETDGVPAPLSRVPPGKDALQAAIVLAAEDRLDEAVTRLDFPEATPRCRMARAFYQSVVEGDDVQAVRARCERTGVALGTLTILATSLERAELVYLALLAYEPWLAAPDAAPTDEQIGLGMAIARRLASLDDHELRLPLLDQMARVMPKARTAIAGERARST